MLGNYFVSVFVQWTFL